MTEQQAIFLINLALIALLTIAILFNRSDESQKLVADLVTVSVSGYLGYLRGTGGKP